MANDNHSYLLKHNDPEFWAEFKRRAIAAGYVDQRGEAHGLTDLIMRIIAEWAEGRRDGGGLEELLGSTLHDWVILYADKRGQTPQAFVRKAVAYACGQADKDRFDVRC